MAEKVTIARLSIDINDIEKESVRLKKQVDSLRKSQKALDTTTEEGAAAYEALNNKIKNTSKAYKDNQKLTTALDAAEQDLNKTLSVENKSTQELYDSRRQLQVISKSIKGDTEDEIKQRDRLNKAIDEQTAKIREQGSNFNSSKDQIGEYKDNINAANFNLRDFVNKSEDVGGATNLVKGGFKSATKGVGQFTKASLRFIATPIGAVLAALVGAFLLIKNAMDRSEESTAKIKTAFGAFTGVAKGILKALQPLGDFLIDGLVAGFELVQKGLEKSINAIQKGLRFLGFDEAADSLVGFTETMKENARVGQELVKAELEYTKAQREARKVQLEYQKDAEKLRQIRDDESKTIPERIKANERLGKVLSNQINVELSLAQKALDFANKRIELEGETTDALNARAEAETEIADIQERITGQESEQLVNRIALQKEAAEQAVNIQKSQLDAFLKSQEVRAKSLEESLSVEQRAADFRTEILKKELKSKLITEQEYNAEILNISNELLRKKAELAADNAKRELDNYIKNNESKLEGDKFLNAESFLLEKNRLEAIAEQRKSYEQRRLEEGVISQQEFNEAINAINEENRRNKNEVEDKQRKADKERQDIDRDNFLESQENNSLEDYEAKKDDLKRQRDFEIAQAEKNGADVELIKAKYNKRISALDNELRTKQAQSAADAFGTVAELLGEQTIAGKAAGIAQATINTYLGATQVLSAQSVLPEPAGTIAKGIAVAGVIASGLASVNKIRSTPTKYARGGILEGRSHEQGGIPFTVNGRGGFEAEGGEAIINKKSTQMFAPLLSAVSVAGGGKKFADGGILGASSNISKSIIDYDLLSESLSVAYSSLPNPVVSVEEISDVSNNISVVENLATL